MGKSSSVSRLWRKNALAIPFWCELTGGIQTTCYDSSTGLKIVSFLSWLCFAVPVSCEAERAGDLRADLAPEAGYEVILRFSAVD